jgi:hypothetical protein
VITVTSEPNVGTAFVITLPLAKEARQSAPAVRGDVATSFG